MNNTKNTIRLINNNKNKLNDKIILIFNTNLNALTTCLKSKAA